MPLQVVNGAATACTMGMTPGTLVVLPINMVNCDEGAAPAATIMDFIPLVNIMPFGMCQSPANPAVAAATAAAMGVLTPMPCIPVVTSPWAPGSEVVMINNLPVLRNTDTNMCTWTGVISITEAGQVTVNPI
jgi:hypothetical protein